MHRVCIRVDSGVPVEKLMRYHVREAHTVSCQILQKVDFGLPRAKFSTRVDLDLEASRMFRPTPRKGFWSNLVLSYLSGVRTLAYRT